MLRYFGMLSVAIRYIFTKSALLKAQKYLSLIALPIPPKYPHLINLPKMPKTREFKSKQAITFLNAKR
jgi:hypothetical protein